MATAHPMQDPLDEEIDRVLADNPGLLERLQDFDRRAAAGELWDEDFVSHDEARRRLGVPTRDPAPDSPRCSIGEPGKGEG